MTEIQLEKWGRKKNKEEKKIFSVTCALQKRPLSRSVPGCLGSLRSLLRKGHKEKHEFSRRLIIQTAPDPALQVPVTLEDEQSYLLGEKDHLLFAVRERKLTKGTAGNLGISEPNLPGDERRRERCQGFPGEPKSPAGQGGRHRNLKVLLHGRGWPKEGGRAEQSSS